MTEEEALDTLGFAADEPLYLSEADQDAYNALMPAPEDIPEDDN